MTSKTKMKPNGKKELPLEARVIQCIAEFPAPKTTQDSVDVVAAEFATANLLRQQADKRYESIKAEVVELYEKEIDNLRAEASNSMTKVAQIEAGVDWNIKLSVNRPASRCDVQELRTELVRQGISVDVIDNAINKVTKKATAALVITATPSE